MANKKNKPKRHYHHNHEAHLYNRLKWTLVALIAIPTVLTVAFLFFGPFIGSLFGFLSINRNNDTNLDTLAPPPPIFDRPVNATNGNNIRLSGFAEEGTSIKLFVNGPETASTITTTDGTFEFENIELIDGRNTIFAKATDASGNESDRSVVINVAVDKDEPKIEIDEPKDEDIIRNLNGRIVIKGSVSEKATVTINDRVAVLRPDFTFEFRLGVEEGEHEITVKAVDEAGNEKEEKFKITYLRQSE